MSSMEEFKAEGFAIINEMEALSTQIWDIGEKIQVLARRFGALCEGTMNAELIGHMSRISELHEITSEAYLSCVGYAGAAKRTIETL